MNIDEVQRRLWEQSQAHRQNRESGTPLFPTNPYGGRIRNLMDLMHNPTWIAAACDRVLKRSRGKAAGVDGVRAHEFERIAGTPARTTASGVETRYVSASAATTGGNPQG